MTVQSEHWSRVKEIFHEARELAPAARAGCVSTACRDDDRLRANVDALLAAHVDAGGFLGAPTLGGNDRTDRFDSGEVFARLQHVLAGRFSLERELGHGGMGIVFLARDVALERPVAVKLLPPALAAVYEHRARFLREAQTAAGLSHPNIVAIHGVEEHGDLVFFIMSLVDGESLAQRVKRAGPLTPADAAKLVQEVAWALAYAHGRGVIHRDIKPDNILLEKGSGRALVSDFGIARVLTAATMSQQGEVMGTLRYMSPEQATGQPDVDGRSDLYSLGVTAYFALTGRLPFESPNASALLAMHLAHPAPPVRSVNPAIPSRLAEAVDRCLAKDPAARHPSGEALADAVGDSNVARREIAPSVRQFLSATRVGMASLTGLGFMWGAVLAAVPRVAPSGSMMGHPLDPIFAILFPASFFAALMPLIAARGVVRAGLDERDVAEAVVASSSVRDANVEYELARAEGVARRMSHPILRALMLGLGGTMVWWIATKGLIPALMGRSNAAMVFMLIGLASAGFLAALAIVPRRVAATLTRGTPEHASLLRRLWTSPVGRWLFRVAGIGLSKRRGGAVVESAPTEVLLGRAAGALFDQLPADQRKRLGDVHDVIAGLERAAVALRVRRDELIAAAGDVGGAERAGLAGASEAAASPRRATLVADLEAARAPLEKRLQSAVSALENLRLDLLRLRAGVGHPDDLTASLEEARAVGQAVDVELAALREVRALAP
ncbi:MAG: serine/threonine-protein kinase [Gemmatimonadaceae bacterium]